MENNELTTFASEQFGDIRTLMIDDEPWFVGRDVATALGYANTKDALIKHVDDDDKQILRSQNATLENSKVPNRGLTIINESGLYALIFASNLNEAKQFKHWVTAEVLPSIRKTGAYNTHRVTKSERKGLNIMKTYVEAVGDFYDNVISLNKSFGLTRETQSMLYQNFINSLCPALLESFRIDSKTYYAQIGINGNPLARQK